MALEYVGVIFQADREIVLEAVKNGGSAIQFSGPFLQTDHDIVRAAS